MRWGDLCAAALQPGPGRVDLRAGPLRWARAGPLRWARPCPAAAAFLSSIHRCSVVSPTRARIDASEQARTGDREQARTGTGRPRGRVSSGCAQVTSRADRTGCAVCAAALSKTVLDTSELVLSISRGDRESRLRLQHAAHGSPRDAGEVGRLLFQSEWYVSMQLFRCSSAAQNYNYNKRQRCS